MKALIFNSGIGKRMGTFTQANHKSMARLANGETIFGRQLRLLAAAGITEVVVTTGPFADQLAAQAAAPHLTALTVTFVPNPDYTSTNYIYSMYLARKFLDDDVLMLHGDLVFNAATITALLQDPRPDLGAVNRELPQPDKDFKARVEGGIITEVSVSIADANCYTFQPLYKLSRRALDLWLSRVDDFVAAGNTSVYAENALNEISGQTRIEEFSYADGSVNEVDTLEDLERVSAEIREFDFAEQPAWSQPDDYRRIPQLLKQWGARRPLLVGGNSVDASFLAPFLTDAGVETVRFREYSSNPKWEEVQAGHRRFLDEHCDAVISIGGGSAMDVAKCVKILAATGDADLPTPGTPTPSWVPHLAIPATAGTGSEATHFSVVYVDGEKHSVAHDAMLPDTVVLEPRLLETLPDYHKKASLLDALSQCIESSWSLGSTDESRAYASRGIELILKNLFPYFFQDRFDIEAHREMLLAAHLGGKAINLTKTTAPHAMSYKLTSMYGIAHGHAVALCLVGVWWQFLTLAKNEPPTATSLSAALDRLTVAFGCATRAQALEKFVTVLDFVQLGSPPLGDPQDIDVLVGSVNQERLGNSPVPLTQADIRQIYEWIFGLRSTPLAEDPAPRGELDVRLRTQSDCDAMASLHDIEAGILRDFDAFCVEHDLRYYLSEGSLLGAVRHGGIIPWDDDVDVMMPRDDYDRLVALYAAGDGLPDHHLDCFDTNDRHWVFGAKLQLTRPTPFRLPQTAHLSRYDGPFIDIFPVDRVRRTAGPRLRAQSSLLKVLRRSLFMKSGRSRGLRTNTVGRVPLYLATPFIPIRRIHQAVVWTQTRFNSADDATSWANLCSYYPIDREIFPADWFGAGRRVMFQGVSTIIPVEAERMVESIYGADYAEIPVRADVDERSHNFAFTAAAGLE